MANQVVVTQSGNVQVSIQPTPNVQVQVSRAAIGNVTVSNVSVANTANYAHQVLDAAQPNITSLGTITGLTSSGNITAPFFLGNVVGNISGNIVVPGTNTSVLFNDAGVAGASDAFQFNKTSNTVTVSGNLSATNISGNGAGLSSITGANVTGQVSYAAVANSVAGSNVSGAVAYATTANSVAGGNVSGQVAYAAVANSVAGANVSGAVNLATYATTANAVAGANVSGTVANATHATVADSANSVAGSNVSGQVSYAAVANSVAGANVSGQVSYAATANSVALANVVGAGNIASINIDGNGGNVLYGNGVFAAVVAPTSVANANYANYAGNVTTSAQPNITSLGTLTGLTVAGDATVTGNLAVDGNLTYVNVTNLVVQDPVIEMGGGPNGAPLTTNDGRDRGSLLHYYTTQPVDAFMGWDNSNGEFGFGSNVTNTNDVMTFNSYGNVRASTFIGNLTGTASHATVADSANSVAGANVSGAVNLATYATTANAVAGANVSGQVSYAAVANSVAGANVSGDVSGSNHANVADVANSVSGSNVSGAVNLANYATTANSVAGANVSGEVAYAAVANSVAVANVSGIGNIAVLNLDGNVSNILHGNGYWGPESESGNANYANFAGTAFSVSGSNVVGEVANAAYATNSGHATVADSANSVAGGNVSGQVANALVAGTVYTNAQPNITSVGTLTSLDVSGNATFGNITNVDSITFDTANVAPGAVGRFTWNDGDGTLDLGLKGGNVTLQVGEELVTRVYNDDSVTLTDGMVVQITGAQGNRIAVRRAQADTETNSVHTLGMVTESIAVGAEGFITTVGTVHGLNTIGLTAGATLYLSPSTLGGYTETKPTAPDQLVVVGFVERVHATVGSIYVKVDNGYELDELHNVLITSPTSGQALVYNSSNLWVNGVPAYANTANSVSVANVSGIGNIATINLDGNVSNILHGDGSFGPETTTGNANYAAYAGNVTIATQSNITSLGNLVSLTVKDSNTSNPSAQFVPTGNVVGNTSFSNSFIRIDQYSDLGNANGVQNLAFVKSRGTSASPTATANNDTVLRLAGHVFNGNTYPKAFQISVTAPQAANANFQLSNTVYTPGSMSLSTGNPFGNVANTNAVSALNTLVYNQNGTLSLLTGSPSGGTTAPPIVVTTYGYAANGVGAGGLITIQRARGNRDGNLAVDNNDQLGGFGWAGYNGNAFYTTRFVQIRANVNTAHGAIANGSSVPADLQFLTCSNTTSYQTTFYGNGVANFPGDIITTANANVGNLNVTGNANVTNTNITGTANVAGNIYLFANGTMTSTTYTNGSISLYGANGTIVAPISNVANTQLNQFQEVVYSLGTTSGTITPDFVNGSIQKITLNGNMTWNNMSNSFAGRSMTMIITQDATGGRTLTSSMLFAGGSKTLSTAANAVDIVSVFYDGTSYYATLSKGYA